VTNRTAGAWSKRFEHARQVHAVEPGHPNVEEHCVDGIVVQNPERRRCIIGFGHHLDAAVLAKQTDEVAPRRGFIVDHDGTDRPAHPAATRT
jgi:hypothetical protein